MNFCRNALDPDSVSRYLQLEKHLNDLLEHEEKYWKQRSKIFWLREGDDSNSRFFHNAANARRKINNLSQLVDDVTGIPLVTMMLCAKWPNPIYKGFIPVEKTISLSQSIT